MRLLSTRPHTLGGTESYAKMSPIVIPDSVRPLQRTLHRGFVQNRGWRYCKECGYVEQPAHHEARRVVIGPWPRLPRHHPRWLRPIGSMLEGKRYE